ncbi:MAG: endolytic transglycosylase MltG [Methylococcaceae bacterium]|nr:endolytic transglycosylase MltG [Methylococcaceae bacterium]
MKRKIFARLSSIFLALILWFYFAYKTVLTTPAFQNNCTIEIEKGDSFTKVTDKLVAQGLVVNPLWLKVLAYRQQIVHKLKVGEYELTANLTIPEILTIFAEGKSKKYAITFPEGWNLKEVLQEIQKNQNIQSTLSKEFTDISSQLEMTEKHPEGWIFPDTYFFEKHTTDISILKRAYNKMQAVLTEEWQNKDQNLPYKTPHEALIMASIIEKETGAKNERQMIAGVFTRRLAKGMLLQTDPTVIYGMGDKYQGNIRASDLTTPTPYNTYVIQGLPPTPIAMPGREAIYAALHPDKDENLYFVAKGDGSHQFSKTISEHNKAVNTFQKRKK